LTASAYSAGIGHRRQTDTIRRHPYTQLFISCEREVSYFRFGYKHVARRRRRPLPIDAVALNTIQMVDRRTLCPLVSLTIQPSLGLRPVVKQKKIGKVQSATGSSAKYIGTLSSPRVTTQYGQTCKASEKSVVDPVDIETKVRRASVAGPDAG
jgi:hypothetical protein